MKTINFVCGLRNLPGFAFHQNLPRTVLACGMLLFCLITNRLEAEVRLASPFTDHMVLQRQLEVRIWGTAAPHERVTVKFAGQNKSTEADTEGNWHINLAPLVASAEGRALTVSGSDSPQPLVVKDVFVGEVWLASGQSNMDFTVSKKRAWYAGVTNEEQEIAVANYPQIRMFKGDLVMRDTPQHTMGGQWWVCTPDNVPGFSAVAYFFARDLHQALKIPVGIVCLAYGGSTCESWIRREALKDVPELKPMLDRFDASNEVFKASVKDWKKYEKDRAAWEQGYAASRLNGERYKVAMNHADPSQDNHNPTVLFNGMINPVIPYALRGVIWYQGESIVNGQIGRNLYPLVQATLVRDWRKLWGREDFPFYIVQLAACDGISPDVRQAQAAVLALPNTGMAVIVDTGDRKNIHPNNKQVVGDRLTRIALAKTYGQKLEYSGPWLKSVSAEGPALRLEFSHATGGLVIKGEALKTAEIAGADKKFVPAMGDVKGSMLILSNTAVAKPAFARYAWAGFPEGCNLYNAAGLPAAPFHSEQLPKQTP